ncbi:unnamed protein product [Chondrus crispus]|uniref:Uncharacterized protein n=1 Tax=Chondrus crispus TaxID=2769 RepID=R7Q9R6_CHOCR|nr:unnamed protein product [Chondrus crispus]CDF34220.1 unnamed protein product [Chondrus crispus]|eukprot:XP_005714039.1 unnamed protein product [Chondrus crispus]
MQRRIAGRRPPAGIHYVSGGTRYDTTKQALFCTINRSTPGVHTIRKPVRLLGLHLQPSARTLKLPSQRLSHPQPCDNMAAFVANSTLLLQRSALRRAPLRRARHLYSQPGPQTRTRASLSVAHALPALASLPTALPLAEASLALSAGKILAGPGINLFNFVMVVRIILSWYPKTDLAKPPWIYIAVPTEPLLSATRKIIPPVGGVDISPIVWFAIMSFVHEILVGPQGLLVLLGQK